VLPWGAYSLIGTTDVDDDAPPGRVAPRPEDVRYLLEGPSRALPGLDPSARPRRAFAGLRSLVRGGGRTPWGNPREHRIVEHGTFLTLLGGKYTTHRSFAERVVDRAVRLAGIRAPRSVTATTPLPDRRTDAVAKLRASHPALLSVGEGIEIAEAAVVHAARAERARRLEDVLLRRTRLWLDRDAMARAAAPVAEWMAPHAGWDDAARAREVRAVREMLAEEERIIEAALAAGGTSP
jgi:glycerol-3-phosphate dehydrogenase